MEQVCKGVPAAQEVLNKFLTEHPEYSNASWSGNWLLVQPANSTEMLAIEDIKDADWKVTREKRRVLIDLERELFKAGHEACDCKTLMELLERHPIAPGTFRPAAFYNHAGDQLEVFWHNDSCFAEEVKGRHGYSTMCLMRSHEVADADLCGVNVYGIKQLLEEAGFKIVPIEDK